MPDAAQTPYRVLARKYRPTTFGELVGQEAMVRTLSNAFARDRIAHAFVLTGVRGIGKTTTARIIARALNCIGADGQGGPTVEPCGICEHCIAIAEDRHVDVIEMDAASRTGVGDMRELIDGVRYRPVSARYKIYIIDEVHMLSTSAFNALLKTLEEPPAHVKFVFATTEIRRLPVTVLSRCQRFDLRRLDIETLTALLGGVAERESVPAEAAALAMLARAADGSARDGLSLLDQAIVHGDGQVTAAAVRDMLGLADRTGLFDLVEAVLRGQVLVALDLARDLYAKGADPVLVVQDLLEAVHGLTRMKLVPSLADDPSVPEAERVRGGGLAADLSVPVLARTWQMLLKGLQEVQAAPNPLQALEMLLIRLTHVADLPPPGELARRIAGLPDTLPAPGLAGGAGAAHGASGPRNAAGRAPAESGDPPAAVRAVAGGTAELRAQAAVPDAMAPPADETAAAEAEGPAIVSTFEELVALAGARREPMLQAELAGCVRLVRFEQGLIEYRPTETAPPDLPARLGRALGKWTGRRWMISLSQAGDAPTLRERRQEAERLRRAEIEAHPLIREALAAFPGAEIAAIRSAAPGRPQAPAPGIPPGVPPGFPPASADEPAQPLRAADIARDIETDMMEAELVGLDPFEDEQDA